ncbi:BnaCnng41170D [Brassica napus]|uniref:(rape) hypothetical protein n=1 Tax=Brassica napus TaxID=3708 RepID=A0A078JE83_BRANA|nr:thioredoxin-like protein CDSP32, chloroplastic [Brassica napus]CAF1912288.1 unnamed protein product [Brassica napus]CDY62976.1 BnaCnng41170D [Brassica napus]
MGDESEKTRELCRRDMSMEKIHKEEGIGPDQLTGDVLYYGDNHSAVGQSHGRADVEKLIDENRSGGKLIVLDVGPKHCGPCVKVYPTVLKLSRSMSETVVFARMNGDENDSCMEFLKDMNIIEVPTFLFIRNGDICGRYVGSGKGELIGEENSLERFSGIQVFVSLTNLST